MNKHGVPAGEVLSVAGILDHEHIRSRELIKHFDDVPGAERDIEVAGAGYRLGSGDPVPDVPPPELGEHTETLLGELGYSDDDIRGFREQAII